MPEARGEIKPGDRLIEATSGNTGIALAMVAAIKGYKMTLIMPDNMSDERKASMKAYGAEIILTPAAGSMEGPIARQTCPQKKLMPWASPRHRFTSIFPKAKSARWI